MMMADKLRPINLRTDLAPLADCPYRVLRTVAAASRWLYDFQGLHAFKAKLGKYRNLILYSNPRYDLSDEVLKKLGYKN